MFSRIATKFMSKPLTVASRRMPMLTSITQRNFYDKLGLESTDMVPVKAGKQDDAIEFWREYEDESNAIALKSDDDITNYVLEISKDYFRTTKKASLGVESLYEDHGLDKYDLIELIIQVEDDLGYVIDPENLTKFKKPKHFVNFIKQIEAYKTEFGKLPTDDTKASFSFKEAFPTSGGGH